jgi:hypothetical protein
MARDENASLAKAPELQTSDWLNTSADITLESLRGRVVLIEAFQMLCPGCVSHGLPQAMRVAETFNSDDVCVLGLHTVFEHQEAQGTRAALGAFLHEYRIRFLVAIDAPSKTSRLPKTMGAYGMQGTPTLLLIDRDGYLRSHRFGREQDMVIGAEIMALVQEGRVSGVQDTNSRNTNAGCDDTGCLISSAEDAAINQ